MRRAARRPPLRVLESRQTSCLRRAAGIGLAPSPCAGAEAAADDAFAAARAALPDDASFFSERGYGYLELQVFDKALEDGLQAVAVAPQSGRAWMLVGSAYESLGDTASAYDAYSQASTVSEETDPQITAIARMRMAGMLQAIQAPSEITPEP